MTNIRFDGACDTLHFSLDMLTMALPKECCDCDFILLDTESMHAPWPPVIFDHASDSLGQFWRWIASLPSHSVKTTILPRARFFSMVSCA